MSAEARLPVGAWRAVADRWDLVTLAFLPLAAVMLLSALTPVSALFPNQADVLLYYQNAQHLVGGQRPYLDFALEYPPLALVPMVVPYLAWPFGEPSFETYASLFALQNGCLAAAAGIAIAWLAARPGSGTTPARALSAWALLGVIAVPYLAWRLEASAAALAVAGVALAVARRPAAAGAVLAVGTLVKVFPVALVPVLVAWSLARGARGEAARLAVGVVIVGASVMGIVAALVGIEPALAFVRYEQDRLVQVESIAASIALVGHLAWGSPVEIVHGFSSVQVTAPGMPAFLAVQSLLAIGSSALVTALAFGRFRGERRACGEPTVASLVVFLAAAVGALIVTNKVFSVQYVVWLLPFAALLSRRHVAVVAAMTVLSLVIHPLNYAGLIDLDPAMVMVLAARNAILVGLVVLLLHGRRPMAAADSPDEPDSLNAARAADAAG